MSFREAGSVVETRISFLVLTDTHLCIEFLYTLCIKVYPKLCPLALYFRSGISLELPALFDHAEPLLQ